MRSPSRISRAERPPDARSTGVSKGGEVAQSASSTSGSSSTTSTDAMPSPSRVCMSHLNEGAEIESTTLDRSGKASVTRAAEASANKRTPVWWRDDLLNPQRSASRR